MDAAKEGPKKIAQVTLGREKEMATKGRNKGNEVMLCEEVGVIKESLSKLP